MEKRNAPRIRRRLVVSYEIGPLKYTGFTRDLATSALWVVARRLPVSGSRLTAWLHLPDAAGRLELSGRVVRSHAAASALPGQLGGGFGLALQPASEAFRQLVEEMQRPA